MLLTSIKLSGFKSFVDPTHLQIQGKLVGVVGPNGCGKSNVIDAVRWVLGESRASELRGESMQDVIFNGTSDRKSAGRASVELIFDNAQGRAAGQWSQYAEIAVRRTLTREGSSVYYINNQVVRRRDIQDIFLGTGLGPRAYAIVGQGMISRLIEARPEELRIFLEEAAGVSRYKERRRETENRLHDTRENLLRVDDILRELDSNLKKLERQAEVARRFHTLQEEQDHKQKLLWLMRKNEAAIERKQVLQDIDQANNTLESQMATLRRFEAEVEQKRQQHFEAGDKSHLAQGALYQTNAEIGSLEAQIRFVIESRARMQAQIDGLKQQQQQWQTQGKAHQDTLEGTQKKREEGVVRLSEAQSVLEAQNKIMPEIEQAWRNAQQAMQTHREVMNSVQQKIALTSAQHRNVSQTLTTMTTRRDRLVREGGEMVVPDQTKWVAVNEQLAQSRQELEQVQTQFQEAQGERGQREENRRVAQSQYEAATTSLAQVRAKLSALKQLQESVQTKGKVQPWLGKHELGEMPRLWAKIRIQSGWEKALEAVLRERMSAIQVSKLDWIQSFFKDAPPAKLAFFAPNIKDAITPETLEGFESLASLLQSSDESLMHAVQEWLSGVFVVSDAQQAFSSRHLLAAGASFITPDGHMVDRVSVRFYAADSEQEGILSRLREMEELTTKIEAEEANAQKAKAFVDQETRAFTQWNQSLQEGHQRIQSLTRSVHDLQMQSLQFQEKQQRFEDRKAQISSESLEIGEQVQVQQRALAEAETQLAQLDQQLAEKQGVFEQSRAVSESQEQKLSEARVHLRQYERAMDEAAFNVKSQGDRILELERSITVAQQQAEKLSTEMQQGQFEFDALDDEAAQAGLQTFLQKRAEQEKALVEARDAVEQIAQQLRGTEEARMRAEQDLLPLREKIVELQLKEQAVRINETQFAEHLQEAKADEAVLAEALMPDMSATWLQTEVTRLGNAINQLGAVNLAALDELKTASERKIFLDEQHADLTKATETLEDAIRRIDRETRTLFQNTFDQVNQHFSELFPTLFGGGKAQLLMTGEEILDSGVQVMAQPPGKKNATIHLLSGGEKALTAIALVFALFQLNPAPFCLLDEVDAPLDDANTERYCNMVKKMAEKTQFLFISHNKIAMEMAQQLMGVTMQEQGVSRIVTVGLESAVEFAS